MTNATNNPSVAAIQQDMQKSYTELQYLLEGPIARLDTPLLYATPLADEWSLMQNVAHIIEFLPYWANEIEKLVAHPGQNFGRTQQHEGRLRAIEEHSRDSLAWAKSELPRSYERLEQVIATLNDSDLELPGRHSKFGEQSLDWFIQEFVTDHFKNHVQQVQAVLTALAS